MMASEAVTAVTVPSPLVGEFHAHDAPFVHDLAQGGTGDRFRPGWVSPTERPGFGIGLDGRVGRRDRLPGSRRFGEPA